MAQVLPPFATRMRNQQRFTPNGMRVLLPLLEAYPRYCPYDVLVASLFSISLFQARRQLQDS